MQIKFIEKEINYDGSQLSPLYAYINHRVEDDSILAFRGGCNVSFEKMIDAEDLVASSKICSDDMLHFIVEIFNESLVTTVAFQRILVGLAQEILTEKNYIFTRSGDDLYYNQKKLSVSIASKSAVSCMIHLGINIKNSGTPVETCALEEDFRIDHKEFAVALMKRFAAEFSSVVAATKKVKPLS